MKKNLILAAAMLLMGFTAQAQNYMVVNSEKIFTSIPAYVQAMDSLDKQAEIYQQDVAKGFDEVEKMYNDYQQQKSFLSDAARRSREDAIIAREQEIVRYQESIFGQEGELLKRRVSLIKPIQDRVFGIIANYAQANKYDLVLDIAASPTIIYYTPSADKTEEIIKLTK